MVNISRKIAFRDFFESGEHIYEDQLGFNEEARFVARSNVMHDIFVYHLDDLHYDLSFFNLEDENFYFIASLENPMRVVKLPKQEERSRFVYWQCDHEEYEDGELLCTYPSAEAIWRYLRINGKSLEEILPKAYVLKLG